MKNKKTETIEEFLARGGRITFVPSNVDNKKETVHSTVSSPVVIMSLDEAELFYSKGEKKVKATKKKQLPRLDINALPAHLKKKFVDSVLNEADDE